MDFWAIDRMNDRNLIGMDGGFREQPRIYVLLDFGPEDLGRREMLEERSGHRETAGNEGARDVTDNVAEGTVIGGTIARSADAEKRQNIVAADTDCRHALRIGLKLIAQARKSRPVECFFALDGRHDAMLALHQSVKPDRKGLGRDLRQNEAGDRKSTRLNYSH